MRALFLGGSQHGVVLELREHSTYWDFPIRPTLAIALTRALPDEILKTDRARYKLAMISPDGTQAIFTECGDAINALTRSNDWIVDADPERCLRWGRKPQPVYTFPRR